MQQPARKTTSRPASDQNVVAGFTDVRPAAAKIELASPYSIDVKAALRKRAWLAVLVLLATLLAGAPYILKKAPREYHAEVTIYVSPTYFKNIQNDREQLQISYSTLVNQQILTIRRYDILSDALTRLEGQGIHWQGASEPRESAVARLKDQLDIQHIPDSYEVSIGLNGESREWVAPILNTVANTYVEKRKREELADRSSGLDALMTEQTRIETELQQKLDHQTRLSQELTMANLVKADPVDVTLLASSRQALEEARRKRIEAESQLAIMGASTPGTGKTPLNAVVEETVANDPNLRQTMTTLVQRRAELRAKIEAQDQKGLKPEFPLRKATEKELAEVNDQIARLPRAPAEDASARLLAKLRGDVERTRLLESRLEREVQTSTSKVRALAKQVEEAQGLTGEIENLRKTQSAVNARIQELTMQETAPGYLRIFSAAQTPIAPNKSVLKKLLGLLGVIALLLAVALPVAMDLIDQRVFSPFDIKRATGFPPVGVVLDRARGTQAFAEEHFRRLVNGIQRGIAVQGAKSVVLTPLKCARTPDRLVVELGRALVARGLKIVIIDANSRRGEQQPAPNHSDILGLNEPPPSAVQNGDRVPLRIDMGSPKEFDWVAVPVVARVGSMLEQLTHEYDVVLVDAPPLQLSADTEFLAAIADITLVVVETGHATRRDVISGANLLGRIGAPSIGVIMSQVRLNRAGSAFKRDFKRFSSLSWSTAPDTMKA